MPQTKQKLWSFEVELCATNHVALCGAKFFSFTTLSRFIVLLSLCILIQVDFSGEPLYISPKFSIIISTS